MTSVLVTGSTDGIGLETARQLLAAGHDVVAHARDDARADDVRAALPGLRDVLVGDLASMSQTRELAAAAGAAGPFDVVVHNAGVGGETDRTLTEDGLERIFAVNTVATYLLTVLVPAPARLVYLTSGLEAGGTMRLDDLRWERREWDGMQAYSDSKLHDVTLALAVARLWPGTISNAVDPGWIRTRMGGAGATDDVADGAATQVWLATSQEPAATATGRYVKRFEELEPNPAATDPAQQDALLDTLAEITGTRLLPSGAA